LKEQVFVVIVSVLLNLNIKSINLFHFCGEDDFSDVCSCNWVIESLALVEPLIGKVSVAVSHQSSVAWQNVLLSANRLNVIFN